MIARYSFITALVCLIFVLACETPKNPTYDSSNPDPNPANADPAVISSIDPSIGFLKEVVTITGTGFNTDPAANLVQFGTGVGTVLTATATELTVELPSLTDDTVMCRIVPRGAVEWSNELEFIFKPAVLTVAEGLNWPMGVEADDDGNVYVGSATDEAIYKIDSDGNQTVYASNVLVSGAIGWGPGGDLFVASSWESKVFRVSNNGATVADYIDSDGAVDFDWAQNGNMYIISGGGDINMYDGSSVTNVASGDGQLVSCRVIGDTLYVSRIWGGLIYKYPITPTGLGAADTIWTDGSPVGIEGDVNGTLLYSLAWDQTLFTLDQNGNDGTLFEGEIGGDPMRYFTYNNKSLYIAFPAWSGDGDGYVMQIYLGVDQAPNWGNP